ncbi:LolA family protein [Salinicoccus bachuensis]|uniref:Outer membrane lipoprotein carrier protein LolA n=1 Tax=Salinicoccus bachuensis TaxID=3136731 RepID=A0ABZ3CKG8_9STAP
MKHGFILRSLIGVLLLMTLGACTSDDGTGVSMDQNQDDVTEEAAPTEESSPPEEDAGNADATNGGTAEASESISKEVLLQKASEVDQLMENYYLESKVTMYTDEQTDETLTREWFYWKNGELHFRKEIERAGVPTQYITGNDQDSTIYTEGEDIAIRTETLVPGADLPSPSKAMKERISSYKMSHDSEVVGQEEVNGRKGHHLVFTPKEEAMESGTTMELWIDSEHWLTLKEVLDQGDMRMEYEVVTFVEGIEPSMDLFHMELPADVEIIDQ